MHFKILCDRYLNSMILYITGDNLMVFLGVYGLMTHYIFNSNKFFGQISRLFNFINSKQCRLNNPWSS